VTQLILVKLCSFDHVGDIILAVSGKVYLNFSTASATVVIVDHVFVQLGNGIIISSGSDVQHQGVLWLEILAKALEKPLVTVDLTIIPLLNGKDKIDSTALKCFII
jgi:hypothetical protein